MPAFATRPLNRPRLSAATKAAANVVLHRHVRADGNGSAAGAGDLLDHRGGGGLVLAVGEADSPPGSRRRVGDRRADTAASASHERDAAVHALTLAARSRLVTHASSLGGRTPIMPS